MQTYMFAQQIVPSGSSAQRCPPTATGPPRGFGRLRTGRRGIAAGAYRRRSNPSHFKVMDISPPPESLGVHCLPPNTTNGDQIEIDGQSFIVEKTRVRWKLQGGKYVRDHQGLDVLGTSRYLSNMFLNGLLEKESGGETSGEEDE